MSNSITTEIPGLPATADVIDLAGAYGRLLVAIRRGGGNFTGNFIAVAQRERGGARRSPGSVLKAANAGEALLA